MTACWSPAKRWKRKTKRSRGPSFCPSLFLAPVVVAPRVFLLLVSRFFSGAGKISERTKRRGFDGDPSYFISRWYCHHWYICVYIQRFASRPPRVHESARRVDRHGGNWPRKNKERSKNFSEALREGEALIRVEWKEGLMKDDAFGKKKKRKKKWMNEEKRRGRKGWRYIRIHTSDFSWKRDFKRIVKINLREYPWYKNRVWPRSTGRFGARKVSSDTKNRYGCPEKIQPVANTPVLRGGRRGIRPYPVEIFSHTDSRHTQPPFSIQRDREQILLRSSCFAKLRSENENFTSEFLFPRKKRA